MGGVMVAVGVASIATEIYGAQLKTAQEEEYYEMQLQQLRLYEEQTKLESMSQKIQSEDKFRHLLGEQSAFIGSSGLEPGSFQPITIGDVEQYSKENETIDMNLQFKENAIHSQMLGIKQQAHWAPINNMFGAAQGIWNSVAIPAATGLFGKGSPKSQKTVTTMPRFSGAIKNINDGLVANEE